METIIKIRQNNNEQIIIHKDCHCYYSTGMRELIVTDLDNEVVKIYPKPEDINEVIMKFKG